jgi:predicted Zn finger-like uncharacterized protein
MSLKTRCPSCDTVFKIVPDQLKVSKGWVRCGRCAEVFDAAAHAAAPDEANIWPKTSPPETVTHSKATPAKVTSAATLTTAKIAAKDAVITPKNVAAQAINTPAIADLVTPKKQVETDLSFVKIAKNKAFWQQKNVAASLRAACLGLVGLLFLQVGFSQRNHLVAANPALKPSFESFCQTLGCNIEAFKNIDAFKIDSSSFQKAPMPSTTVVANTDAAAAAQADAYTLKISLKNNIDLPLAIPSIELTLTDASDKPVLRRVLSTQDFGSDRGVRSDTLAANADWSGEMTVAVTANRALPPISGYRVLLFYP